MSVDNTSPSPHMSRVYGKRGRPKLSAAEKGTLASAVKAGATDAYGEPVREVRMPYLRFLDPACQKVRTPS